MMITLYTFLFSIFLGWGIWYCMPPELRGD